MKNYTLHKFYKPTSNQLSSSLNWGNLPYTTACQRRDWILFKWICALPSNSLILKFQIDIYVRRIILFFFLSFFFWCVLFFFKSLLNLLQHCFCFMFWFFGDEACGILAPRPDIKPIPHWKCCLMVWGSPLGRWLKKKWY